MTILSLPDDPAVVSVAATYVYERAENGDGAMTFTFAKNVVTTTLAAEVLMVESRWLGTGPGRADTTVTGGDTPGGMATALECWNQDFESSYRIQSWNAAAPTGDPASCIPLL